MMAHGIVAVSIITALMPRMSAAAADGRYGDVADDLSRGTRMAAAVLAPIAVCYVVLADADRGGAVRLRRVHRRRRAGHARRADRGRARPGAVRDQPALHVRLLRAAGHQDAGAGQHRRWWRCGSACRSALFAVAAASLTVAAGLMLGNAVSYVAAAVLSALAAAPPDRPDRRCVGSSSRSARCSSRRSVPPRWRLGASCYVLPGGDEPSRLASIRAAGRRRRRRIGVTYLGARASRCASGRSPSVMIGLVRRRNSDR